MWTALFVLKCLPKLLIILLIPKSITFAHISCQEIWAYLKHKWIFLQPHEFLAYFRAFRMRELALSTTEVSREAR